MPSAILKSHSEHFMIIMVLKKSWKDVIEGEVIKVPFKKAQQRLPLGKDKATF